MTQSPLTKSLRWAPVVGACLVSFAIVLLFRRDLQASRDAQREAEQFEAVERGSAEIVQLLTDAETAQRGYVLTGSRLFLERYEAALQKLPGTRAELHRNLEQVPSVPFEHKQVDEAVEAKLEIMHRIVSTYRDGNREAALRLVNTGVGQQRMDNVRVLVAKAREGTRRANDLRVKVRETTSERAVWIAIISGISATLLLVIANVRLGRSLAIAQSLTAELAAQEARYREFAAGLQRAHEDERATMARKVHDEIGQNLTAAKIDIVLSLRKLEQDPQAQHARLTHTTELLDDTIQIARNLSMELRPAILDQAGLLAATEWQLRQFQARFGIESKWHPETHEPKIPRDAKLALFRILQEALTNISRHAHAHSVIVSLRIQDGYVNLTIVDDGIGLDTKSASNKSLGVFGMRERMRMVGGILTLDGAPGHGTSVTASVPLSPEVA